MIKRGGNAPIRLDLSSDGEVNSALYSLFVVLWHINILSHLQLHLIRDYWSERPTDRPTADTLCGLQETMNTEKKANLMDQIFSMLEDYTNTLELDVEESTELQVENKKADILLREMLLSQVADRLMLNQAVESESFDSVTRASGIAEVRGPQTENGPNGEGGTQLPSTSTVSSIAGHHPSGRLTSTGPPHLKS
ncbi:Nitrogen permease regulator 2 [Parelaphostrongylus tenuis]|uniref:Nitrogen permease regulator 2 n=1 Tax=Parelaphostrongylus tenuis TaxID=148309 RepID=A0AAD5MID5_PARTN|nr:Nitrogen permease regulator 2 [Parelaphostrongylus tenuis]